MTFDFSKIRADFADDIPRLLYADWLGEQGQPERGEFVSLEVRLARCEDADATRHDLHRRAAALLKKHKSAWLAPLKPLCMHPTFRRGLVEGVRVRPKAFASQASELFAAAPALHEIWCSGMTQKTAPTWTAIPELSQVDKLELFENRLGAPGLAHLLAAPHLTNLRSLSLRDTALDTEAMGKLGAWPHVAQIETLGVNGNVLRPRPLKALLEKLPHLTSLNLSSTRLDDPGALLTSLPRLRHLDVGWNLLTPAAWRQLGDAVPHLHSLRHDSVGVGTAAATEIASAPWALSGLRFFQAQFDDDAMHALCRGDWAELRSLRTDYNKLGERGWTAFDRAWPALEELYVDPPPTPAAARSLHRLAPQLRSLTFWGSAMNDAVLAALLEVPWPHLHSLRFGHAQLTDASAAVLSDPSLLPVLHSVDLGKAPVKGAALRQLRKRFGWGLQR